ncbi:MAG: class I SAM-dependent methyltransferase [Ichthyobacteriaceae bacterium]|nr:class I SAM-dependent methyltransferase [Ichthyobacteriaceae bacterium]
MKKRMYKNLVLAVVQALTEVFKDGKYADKVIEKTLKKDPRWGARDRGFIAETVYDIVRWKRLYEEVSGIKGHYTNKNIWKLFITWATVNDYFIPDQWDEVRGVIPEAKIMKAYNRLREDRVYRESIPDWMDEVGVKELGEEKWNTEISALNKKAPVVIRVNTLKTTVDKLQKIFENNDIETIKLDEYPDALQLKERKNIFTTEAFKRGFFEIQDASSQLVADFLDVKPGMRVVDACAGAGGKTLHIASKMENKGSIISMDIYGNKLKELKRRAKRDGAHNIETKEITSTKVIKRMQQSADRVLLDAPCSGLGVLKRNPDAKWKLKPEFLETIKVTQAEILDRYSKMVKVGGLLVYATCSILPSENEEQVAKFLENNKNFKLIKDKKVSPAESGYDGFYMAQIERID